MTAEAEKLPELRLFFLSEADHKAIEHERDELMLALMKVNRQRERLETVADTIRRTMDAAFWERSQEWQDSPEGVAVWHWLETLSDAACDEVLEFVQEYPERPNGK